MSTVGAVVLGCSVERGTDLVIISKNSAFLCALYADCGCLQSAYRIILYFTLCIVNPNDIQSFLKWEDEDEVII